ncbi:MAG: creatininase family protein, partial [Spirochaetia bacterium]
MSSQKREIRIECLRPGQLNEEQERCPLVFVPIGPLEYHGPHLPVGMDAINATQCALEACRRLGKGVVHPTLYWGTERERPEWMLESLGFKGSDWIVGMDFPAAIWKSHYYQEHLFALVVAGVVEMLIEGGYKVIVLVNGHGAWNQLETLDRLATHYSHTTDTLVVWKLA